jgi:hypothetical protein
MLCCPQKGTDMKLEDLEYELAIYNNPEWDITLEHMSPVPVQCKHCRVVYNYADISIDECPFCHMD